MKNVIFTLLFSGFMYIYTVLFLYSRVLQVHIPEFCKSIIQKSASIKPEACKGKSIPLAGVQE